MTEHDRRILDGVHPQLQAAVAQMQAAFAQLTIRGAPGDLRPTDGLRTVARQQALWAQGRTTEGPDASPADPLGRTVTNADGITTRSNHQTHGDGYGHAVDCTFWIHGVPSWAEDLPWRLYGEMAKALGLSWGGDWHARIDKSHIELP